MIRKSPLILLVCIILLSQLEYKNCYIYLYLRGYLYLKILLFYDLVLF